MTLLQGLLYRMLGSLIVIIVASGDDPHLLLTTLNSEDTVVPRDDHNLTLTTLNSEDFVASRGDPNLSLTALKSEDTVLTPKPVDKPSHERTIFQDCADVCSFTDRRIECIDCIPKNVTSTVNEIVLLRFNESRFVPHMFCGVLWPRVVNLTILNSKYRPEPNRTELNIRNFSFDCLPQIEILKLGLSGLHHLSVNAFYGLTNTRTLDLTNCVYLEISQLTPSLSLYANLPKLKTLILSNFGHQSAYGTNQISQNFLDIAAHRNITNIDLSFSTFAFDINVSFTGLCKCLEKFNLENARLINKVFLNFPSACDSLRVINLSGMSFPSLPVFVGNITVWPGVYPINQNWMKALNRVSILYINNLIPKENYIFLYNVTPNIQIENSFSELHISGYSAPVFEVKFKINPDRIEYFDISKNKIERLSPDLLANLEHLKRIDLSNNRLAVSKQFQDTFSKLFRNNSKLEIATLARNGMTYLPLNVFELNTELKRVDMSNNKVTQITFEIAHLHKLALLDLRGNLIEYLNTWSRHQLDLLYNHKQETRNTTVDMPFTVDLRDNIFSCKCHSLDFIKWFVQSPLFEDSRNLYYCELDGERISMDTRAIKSSKFDCEKPQRETRRLLLVVLLPCVSTGIFVVMTIVLIKRYKKVKLYRRLREQIELIRENQFEFRFPVFLSYASEDSEFVEPNILQPLEVSFCVVHRQF